MDTSNCQRLVGELIYLPHTWPNIVFAVSLVSQFMYSPYQEHLKGISDIEILEGGIGKCLFLKTASQKTIKAYTYADWVGCITDRKSITGYCTSVICMG